MSADELDGIATFYNLVFRRPVGERVILLCNSISCWIKGCENLQRQIGEQLGIGLGETTADNRYTLLPVTCLGACDKAPVLMVGDELHEDVDAAALRERVHALVPGLLERPDAAARLAASSWQVCADRSVLTGLC